MEFSGFWRGKMRFCGADLRFFGCQMRFFVAKNLVSGVKNLVCAPNNLVARLKNLEPVTKNLVAGVNNLVWEINNLVGETHNLECAAEYLDGGRQNLTFLRAHPERASDLLAGEIHHPPKLLPTVTISLRGKINQIHPPAGKRSLGKSFTVFGHGSAGNWDVDVLPLHPRFVRM
jgi:hypothetical protein